MLSLFEKIQQGIDKISDFNLNDPTLKSAFAFLESQAVNLGNLKGTAQKPNHFVDFIKPLLDIETLSKQQEKPWRIVIDMATQNGVYSEFPNIQFCSGNPGYHRVILTFTPEGTQINFDSACVEKAPNLKAIASQFSPDGKQSTLKKVNKFYSEAGIQRIAILGSARVFPYPKEANVKELPEATKWAQKYTSHIQRQLNGFLDCMEQENVTFTTVNGGWAGTLEQSMGVPMISHLIGTVHDYASGNCFPPVTIMPKVGAFDRVKTRAEVYGNNHVEQNLHIPTYFEIDGVWGDDSKFLVGFSTALMVFEPYGFWTNIEITNGMAQNKPVAIIADPEKLATNGEYHKDFKNGNNSLKNLVNYQMDPKVSIEFISMPRTRLSG